MADWRTVLRPLWGLLAGSVAVAVAIATLGGPAWTGGVSPALASSRKGGGEETAKPRLKLVAEPSVGFTPVTTILTGTLFGVAPDDANFCHPATTWIRINPGQSEDTATRMHEDPACRHPASEAAATTSFVKSFDLAQPGAYLFRLIVEAKDHRRAESATVQVMVLRVQ
jgi:hypothetical protein